MEAGTRAVVYRRVSTTEQGSSGLGLDAQLAACTAYCEARGWIIASVHDDVCSGSAKRRAGLEAAISDLRAGDVLIAAKADRLARSLSMFVRLVERAKSGEWAIVAADGSVDLTTPHGRAMAAMAAVFADLERELIGARTRDALAAARQRGTRLGRPANPSRGHNDPQGETDASEGLHARADRRRAQRRRRTRPERRPMVPRKRVPDPRRLGK